MNENATESFHNRRRVYAHQLLYNGAVDDTDIAQKQRLFQTHNAKHSQQREQRLAELEQLKSKKASLIGKVENWNRKKTNFLPVPPKGHPSSGNVWMSPHSIRQQRSMSVGSVGTWRIDLATFGDTLPLKQAACNKLRRELEQEYRRAKRPYNGELGPQSYQPWQISHYYVARSLVEELVDRVIDYCIVPMHVRLKPISTLDAETGDILRKSVPMYRVAQLVMEEVFLEEVKVQLREIADIFAHFDKYTVTFFARAIETASQLQDVEQCTLTDGDLHFTEDALLRARNNRQQARSCGTWSHSYFNQKITDQQQNQQSHQQLTTIIDFNHILPTELHSTELSELDSYVERANKLQLSNYRQKEAEYWNNVVARTTVLPSDYCHCSTVSVAKSSLNQRLVAYGTTYGDLLIVDLQFTNPRPVACHVSSAASAAAVVDISWSLDSSRLVTVNKQGILKVWSLLALQSHSAVTPSPCLRLKPGGPHIGKLSLICELNAARKDDFCFKSGPLAGTTNRQNLPILACFDTSRTFFGFQLFVYSVLDNGDILRCDLTRQCRSSVPTVTHSDTASRSAALMTTNATASRLNTSSNVTGSVQQRHPAVIIQNKVPCEIVSKIGADVPAELCRGHKDPLLLIGLIDNCRSLVTVDKTGLILLWKYSTDFLTSDGWFRPSHKYQLNMAKNSYSPADIPAKTMFCEDEPLSSAEQRTLSEKLLASLPISSLWHRQYHDDQQKITLIYQPVNGVPATGGVFHVVTRHSVTGALLNYSSQVFLPASINCSRLVSCRLTPTADEIIFLLLFPQSSPKEAHLSLLALNLHTMELRNFRKDVSITDRAVYERCLRDDVISFEVSRVFAVTGSAYVFLNIDGQFSVFSLNSGQKVLRVDTASDDGFLGCSVRTLDVTSTTKLSVISQDDKIFITFYSTVVSSEITFLELTDNNTEVNRRGVVAAFQSWRDRPTLPPTELLSGSHRWFDPVTDPINRHHATALVHSLLLTVVDRVLSAVEEDEELDKEQQRILTNYDRVENYIYALMRQQQADVE